jgi:hypothetical protein
MVLEFGKRGGFVSGVPVMSMTLLMHHVGVGRNILHGWEKAQRQSLLTVAVTVSRHENRLARRAGLLIHFYSMDTRAATARVCLTCLRHKFIGRVLS